MTTINITLGIISIVGVGGIIETCQIKLIIVTASYRNRGVRTYELVLNLILMNTNMELLKPHIASYMVITNRFSLFN